MANSTAPVYFKPTVAFNRGDTFVFGAWVRTADGAGSFQRCLTMPPNPETGFVTLPEVVTGELAGKFGEISLFDHHADFELESASNLNSTSPWAIACEPAAQPSHVVPPPRECSTRGPRIFSRARTETPSSRRAGKEPVPAYNSDSDTAPGHASDSNPLSGFYSDSAYEFDFGSDPEDSESEDNTTEHPLSGPTSGLVITSTPAGRFVYWPGRKLADLISGDSRYVAYIDLLPFQEGTPLARADSNTPTEVASSESSLGTPDRQVFMAAGDTLRPSGTAQDKYLEDISADELSADAPADETAANRDARRERNRKRNERRRRLRDNLPIRNLAEALGRSRAEYTLPLSNASCRSQRSHARLKEYASEKSSPSSLKTLSSCGSTTGSTSLLPLGTATTKLQVVTLTSVATVLEPSSQLSPTIRAQTPADPHSVATATARSSLTAPMAAAAVTLTAAAVTTEAPTTEPTGGPAAAVVAAVETTRTATPPEPHRAATTPAKRLRSCGGRSQPLQATTTASPPSHLDFATCSSPTS
jgi:hypothetical protein